MSNDQNELGKAAVRFLFDHLEKADRHELISGMISDELDIDERQGIADVAEILLNSTDTSTVHEIINTLRERLEEPEARDISGLLWRRAGDMTFAKALDAQKDGWTLPTIQQLSTYASALTAVFWRDESNTQARIWCDGFQEGGFACAFDLEPRKPGVCHVNGHHTVLLVKRQ